MKIRAFLVFLLGINHLGCDGQGLQIDSIAPSFSFEKQIYGINPVEHLDQPILLLFFDPQDFKSQCSFRVFYQFGQFYHKDFNFIFVDVGSPDEVAAKNYLDEKYRHSRPNLLDKAIWLSDGDQSVFSKFKEKELGTAFLLDQDNRVRWYGSPNNLTIRAIDNFIINQIFETQPDDTIVSCEKGGRLNANSIIIIEPELPAGENPFLHKDKFKIDEPSRLWHRHWEMRYYDGIEIYDIHLSRLLDDMFYSHFWQDSQKTLFEDDLENLQISYLHVRADYPNNAKKMVVEKIMETYDIGIIEEKRTIVEWTLKLGNEEKLKAYIDKEKEFPYYNRLPKNDLGGWAMYLRAKYKMQVALDSNSIFKEKFPLELKGISQSEAVPYLEEIGLEIIERQVERSSLRVGKNIPKNEFPFEKLRNENYFFLSRPKI